MSNISYCFRDLESANEGQRKSAALLILAENFDDLRKPGIYQSQKFEELFIPIFKKVAIKTRRQAVLLLSHHRYIPVNLCEFLALQPLDISTPFLSHSPSLSNSVLCYVIAKTNEHYARIIAGRSSLSKRVVQSLIAVNDGQINHILQLRGYIKNMSEKQNNTMSDQGKLLTPIDTRPLKDKELKDEKFMAEEILRQTLRDLAQGGLTPEDTDYAKGDIADMPYVNPVADNNDTASSWIKNDKEEHLDKNAVKAIG